MTHWSARAHCKDVDPEVFYPNIHNDNMNPAVYADAAAVCAVCPVRAECLEEVLAIEGGQTLRYGYRGGKTPRQRRGLASRRPRATAAVGGAA